MLTPQISKLDKRYRYGDSYAYRLELNTGAGLKDSLRMIDYMLAFTQLYGRQPDEWRCDVQRRHIYFCHLGQLTAVALVLKT